MERGRCGGGGSGVAGRLLHSRLVPMEQARRKGSESSGSAHHRGAVRVERPLSRPGRQIRTHAGQPGHVDKPDRPRLDRSGSQRRRRVAQQSASGSESPGPDSRDVEGRHPQLQAAGDARRAGRHPGNGRPHSLHSHPNDQRRPLGDRLRATVRPRPLPHARANFRRHQSGSPEVAGGATESSVMFETPRPRNLETPQPWLRRFTKLVAASTLFLIFAGAMVTSTGSGLAVPDWPLSYGQLMPPMVGGIFYEHGHRMVAATVGFLTVIQAIWLQRRARKRSLRILGWTAVGAVIAQGVLGGLTVLLLLPPAVSIAHAGLAEIFLCLNFSIAFFASRWYDDLAAMEKGDAPIAGTTALVGLVYFQILIGALMRHLHAGLAITTFPMPLVPRATSLPILVNFGHRVGGMIVAIAVIAIFMRLLRFESRHPLRQLATLLVMVVPAQILLGAYTIWSGKQPVITSLHVVTGAFTLALSLLLALTARTAGWKIARGGIRDYLELS